MMSETPVCTHAEWTIRDNDPLGYVWCPHCQKQLSAAEAFRQLVKETQLARDQARAVVAEWNQRYGTQDPPPTLTPSPPSD